MCKNGKAINRSIFLIKWEYPRRMKFESLTLKPGKENLVCPMKVRKEKKEYKREEENEK